MLGALIRSAISISSNLALCVTNCSNLDAESIKQEKRRNAYLGGDASLQQGPDICPKKT